MLSNWYQAIMNSERNPLRTIPKVVRFQVMVALSWMWSLIFALSIGSYLAFGVSLVAHLAILVGILVTTEVFRRASSRTRHPVQAS
jgi:hypothetical protein